MATHSSILAWTIPMDREAWLATVHGVTKSQMQLSTHTLHCQDLMFLSRGDRDLRFTYQTHPRSQASPRGEGKDSTLLSSRDGYVLESTE